MNIKFFLISTIASVSALVGSTQNGYIIGMSDFKSVDMLEMSRYNYSLGTARSAAMGGAFTSLGADLSSMSINPAGLGMYQSSEFGFSPSIGFSSNSVSGPDVNFSDYNKRTRFAINNLGIAFNLYQGTGSVTSFTLGFGYNKLADFNNHSGVGLGSNNQSIAELYARQLNGIPLGMIDRDASPFDNHQILPREWGAVLSYKTGLVDAVSDNKQNKDYTVNSIDQAAIKSHYARMESEGSIGEYAISGGLNINNVVYLGATLGIQDINYSNSLLYEEAYRNNTVDDLHLDFMQYSQKYKYSGTGVNFKFGAVVMPTPGLRIGLAVHTPTFVSLDRSYIGNMYTQFFNSNETGDMNTNTLAYTYNYNSPTRLLAGVSYAFGGIAIISADYERVWYNGMRMSGDENAGLKNYIDGQVPADFKAANNLRVGIEVKPLPMFAIRVGYAMNGSMLNDDNAVFEAPVSHKGYNISAGVGYRKNSFSLDMAYIYSRTDYTQYDLYYYNDDTLTVPISSGAIDSHRSLHNVTLSMGFRF